MNTVRFTVETCSLGPVLIAATDKGVCSIQFGDNASALTRDLKREFPDAVSGVGHVQFPRWVKGVLKHLENPTRPFDIPLDVSGTEFQERVWSALKEIPVGKTASYKDVARKLGLPSAVRAVAGACAANSVAVVIPCHRVVRSDGALSGYRWGVERKRALLTKEGHGRYAP